MDYYQMTSSGHRTTGRLRGRSTHNDNTHKSAIDKSQSQVSLTDVASDQDNLISHPHKHGKVLTDIHAQPPSEHLEQSPADFTNGGILRTIDVSHTVTPRAEAV